MYTVFVTGGIGSGKSSVCHYLEREGAHVYSLDKIAREVLDEPDVIEELGRAFGQEVIREGCIDRAELARRAFADEESTAELNDITHPRIRARLGEIAVRESSSCTGLPPELLVIEVPLIEAVKSELALADEIINVACPLEQRRLRAVLRGMDGQDFDARNAKQIDDATRSQYAQTVFDNSGDEAHLALQLEEWFSDLRKKIYGGEGR